MKSQAVITGVVCLASLLGSTSYAGVTINGTTITFDDNSTQSTANPPSDHGGTSNTVNGTDSFIGGGNINRITDDYGTIGGGQDNLAGDNAGTTSDIPYATIGGGYYNTASGDHSTVSGGEFNSASGYGSTVGGGDFNFATGNGSTIAGGVLNTADGDYSFVAGVFGDDSGNGYSFVWGGQSGARTSAGVDTFNVWSAGGIFLNGSVHAASDRDLKEAFSFISAREVLDKVVEMPVSTWRFKSEDDSVRHIGPMAQDFAAAFGYGNSDKHITSTDADGVALAAIQGLNEKLETQRVEDAEMITALRWQNAQLQARLARLEKAILRE